MQKHLWCPNDPRGLGIDDDDDDDQVINGLSIGPTLRHNDIPLGQIFCHLGYIHIIRRRQ